MAQTTKQSFSLLQHDTGTAESLIDEIASSYNIAAEYIEDVYPCTSMQAGLLSLTSRNPNDYILQAVLQLNAITSLDRFKAAWEVVFRETAILRTRIVPHVQLGFLQVVVREELRWCEADSQDDYLRDHGNLGTTAGHALSRYAIIKGKPGKKSTFIWTIHHSLFDGWFLSLVTRQVSQLYLDNSNDPMVEFKTFVAHTLEQDYREAEQYWSSALQGYDSAHFLASGSPTWVQPEYRRLEHLSDAIQWRGHNIKRSVLAHAAWAIALSTETNSGDVVFGSLHSGRQADIRGIKEIAGPTISTVPIRVNLKWDQKVSTFLKDMERETQDRVNFDYLGLSRIAQINSFTKRACDFPTMIVVQTTRNDLYMDPVVGHWTTSSKDSMGTTHSLVIQVFLEDGGTRLVADYISKDTDEETVRRLLGEFSLLMEQLVEADKSKVLGDLELLSTEDQHRLWQWNMNVPLSVERCVHELIEEQIRLWPEALAIQAWDGDLTYKELDRLSSRLAYRLIQPALGIAPGAVVPLCFEKSKWTTVALLAVLKAGAAFHMLDPAYPEGRLRAITQQTGATVILSSKSLLALSSSLGPQAVSVGPELMADTGRNYENAALPPSDPSSLMYIVFTSGSTGSAKGVLVPHAAFSSSIYYQAYPLGFDSTSRVLDIASSAFDMFIQLTCVTLATGGCLCVPSDTERRNDPVKSIARSKPTLMAATPSLARLVKPEAVPSLKRVILGGEPVVAEDVERWRDHAVVINGYGPSECTPVSVLNNTASAKDLSTATRIGRGAGVVTWVVDPADHNRLVPLGVTGELLLEGPLVGDGYLNDPEKTTAAFIQNPTWLLRRGRRGRLYKTGDLVRYHKDGSLRYIGRKDNQVKIRGQRIELAEVEHHVRECFSQTREAEQLAAEVIVPCDADGTSTSSLLALFLSGEHIDGHVTVGNGQESASNGHDEPRVFSIPLDLENQLAERLPSYMVPSVLFLLPQRLPVTATDKIDRKQLRQIGASYSIQQLATLRSRDEKGKRKPSTKVERTLQQLMATVLDLKPDTIGVDDSFFRLGGDSIAAMKLVAQAREVDLNLSVADIFQKPRISALAELPLVERPEVSNKVSTFSLLDANTSQDIVDDLVTLSSTYGLHSDLIEDIYPCTPLQEGLLALTSKKPNFYVRESILHLSPSVELECFRIAWERVVELHPILRTRIIYHEKHGLFQVVTKDGPYWSEVQTEAKSLDSPREEDTQAMGLGQPLTRYSIITDPSPSFVWTIHHAIYDATSIPLILDSLTRFYHGLELDPYPEYKYFIRHLYYEQTTVRAHTDKSHMTAERFWRLELMDYQGAVFPPLPPSVQEPAADSRIDLLCEVCRVETPDVTLATIIQGAWALVSQSRTGGIPDVSFGVTVSGRNAPVPGIEAMVGPTIATIPLRIQIEPGQIVGRYLEEIQSRMAHMIIYQQTGLQRIAKASHEAEQACAFQTLVVIQPEDEQMTHNEETEFGLWEDVTNMQAFGSYALTLNCFLTHQGGVRIVADYDSRIMDRSTLENTLAQFRLIIQQLARSTDQVLESINALGEDEQHTLWTWNSNIPATIKHCVHELIDEQVRIRPDATAIQSWDGELKYGKLGELSTHLAYQLVHLGVRPKTVVPLCFDKSMWTSVALLAVLKAGAAFCMLDPAHPETRLAAIMRQTNATVILSSSSLVELSSRLGKGPQVVAVGPELIEDAGGSHKTPVDLLKTDPSSLMYIAFTSGSTGIPKGATVSHAAFASGIFYQASQLSYTVDARVFLLATHAFDMFVYNVGLTLATGGCLLIPSEAERNDLLESVIKAKPTLLSTTPPIAQLLKPEMIPSLKTIVLGGEAVTLRDAERWRGHAMVVNVYGPAECTPVSVLNHTGEDPSTANRIGTGSGVVTWVVNPTDHNKLAPLGVIGELLLEGPLVGEGYLNDPVKTSAAFIQDPIWLVRGTSSHPGRHGRLYKTGDLVRYHKDGSLSYIARKDTQVKIRGQRIELGDVEHHVRECLPQDLSAKQVAAEVIEPGGAPSASPILAVFLSVGGGHGDAHEPTVSSVSSTSSEFEAKLAARLPGYMIPSVCFIIQPRLPITATDKVDRKQLRKIGASYSAQQLANLRSHEGQGGRKRKPSTDAEHKLHQLWATVLNLEPDSIGVDDNFFRLGGDSITAMQISYKARSNQLAISTSDILQKKTIANLCRNFSYTAVRTFTSLPAEQVDQPFSLTPIQHLFVHLQPDIQACFDQSFFVSVKQKTSLEDMIKALKNLTSRHSMLRAYFTRNKDGQWKQSIAVDASNSVYLQHIGHEDLVQGISRARAKLDVVNGPLVVVLLVENDNGNDQSLFVAIHHLIVDLVSWRVLFQDLESLLLGQPLSPVPLASFQFWQVLQAEHLSQCLTAESYTPPIEVRPAIPSFWGLDSKAVLQGTATSQKFILGEGVTSALLGGCNDVFQTRPFELMAAALIHSFSVTFPDRCCPAVFNETHGREVWSEGIDLSQTVGWFTSMFPIQVEGDSGSDLLAAVRETKDCARKFPHNGWEYFASHFVNEDKTESLVSKFPVEILFNYTGVYQQLERDDPFFGNMPLLEDCEPASTAQVARFALFDVSVGILKGQMHILFRYDRETMHHNRVLSWIRRYEETLCRMPDILSNMGTEWTLSDFPLAFRSYNDLLVFRDVTLQQLSVQASEVEDVFPCSSMQEGIWISQIKDPTKYHVSFVYEVVSSQGPVDISRLQDAWNAVVRRHALLRALVVDQVSESSRVFNLILKDPQPSISIFHTTEDTISFRQFRGNGNLAEPTRNKLQHRLTICQAGSQKTYICLDINHVILDAHSQRVIMRDLQLAYDEKLDIHGPSYQSFVARLEEQSHENSREYWKKSLHGAEPCLFPSMTDDAEDCVETITVKAPSIDMDAVRALCSKLEITPATVIQVAWASIVSQYTTTTAPCFGTLRTGRDMAINHIDDIVGPLISMVPCQVQLRRQQTVLEVLKAVHDDYVASIPHQTFQLASIHRELKLGSASLFNTMLSLQRSDDVGEKLASPSIMFNMLDNVDPTEYDLTISGVQTRSNIDIFMSFSTAFLSQTKAEELAECLHERINTMVTQPLAKIDELNRLGSKETDKLWKWNSTVPATVNQCTHSLIEEQAQLRPGAAAVQAWDGMLTYGELNGLATRLAGELIVLGIGRGSIVPLCFEKSMWTTVALLGVLKTEAAFCMLDPAHPESRLQSIVQQTGATIILSSISLLKLSSRLSLRTMPVGPGLIGNEEGTDVSLPQPDPSSLMYVAFTSGSTGAPKGALVSHAAFTSGIYYQTAQLQLTPTSRVLDFFAHAFDMAVFNVGVTLAAGACLCVPSDVDRKDSWRLTQSIHAMKTTHTLLTPSVLQLLHPEEVPKGQIVILIGEQLSLRETERWWGHVTIINTYGPCECTPISTVNCFAQDSLATTRIGRGSGAVTWVVDPADHNKLVPPGAVGELVLEGPLVGGGYLNDPEKTSAAFINDPMWLLRGSSSHASGRGRHGRLYKTGDLVRHHDDGSLSYVGRKDTQVKIRGQRIELGDVEHHVQECLPGGVSGEQLAAEVITPPGGASVLAVFFSGEHHNGHGPEVQVFPVSTEVESRLAERLPSYMIPSVCFILPQLPVTATDKIDRKRLREIGATYTGQQLAKLRSQTGKRKPSTEMEHTLQQLWASVLNLDLDSIGVDDSFFRLGGDSIAAMRLVALARTASLLQLSVADIFQHPRLSVLAEMVSQQDHLPDASYEVAPFSQIGTAWSELMESATSYGLDTELVEDIYPCTPLQEGLLALTARRPGLYIRRSVLNLRPDVNVDHFRVAWEHVIQCHPILRTRIVYHEKYGLFQVVVREKPCWSDAKAERLNGSIEENTLPSMGLGQPLHWYSIINNPTTMERSFTWTIHHALYDGASISLMLESLARLYHGLQLEPYLAYKYFVRYLVGGQKSTDKTAEEFWREELKGYQNFPFPPLPPSLQEPMADSSHEQYCVISEPVTTSDITTATVIQAAWALVTQTRTGISDVLFGVTVSGRNTPLTAIEGIVGPTIATIPLRIKVEPHQTVGRYLEGLQSQMAYTIAYQQTGLQRIAKASPEAERACNFQTLLVVQPADEEGLSQETDLGRWETVTDTQAFGSYALTLNCFLNQDQGGVSIIADYDSRVIDRFTLERMLGQLSQAIQQLAQSRPDQVISEAIETLTEEEQQVLWTLNSSVPATVNHCVHDLIEEQVQSRPENALAVQSWDGELTYTKLGRLASRLAYELVALGLRPGAIVPLCFEKSMWTTVAVVAVLKAGAAFCMLDPAHPQRRLEAIIQQTSATIIISSQSNRILSSRLGPVRVFSIGPEWMTQENSSICSSNIALPPSDPASAMCIVFTSGSTGIPKGSVVRHSAFCSNIRYQASQLGFKPTSRVLDIAAHAFDMFVHITEVTLATGGCLCVLSDVERKSKLAEGIVKAAPTLITATPTLAHLMEPDMIQSIETIIIGGELLTPQIVERWWNHATIINVYGPSECTPVSVFNNTAQGPGTATRIGKGAGVVTWVVDAANHNRLVPLGVVGELLLEGPLVGQDGYLNDPERTSAAYIQDPVWLLRGIPAHPGRRGRLYKTGDLVRYHEDGSLSYVGRKDTETQVKIRGQRVELGDVEHHVRECLPQAAHGQPLVAEVILPRGGSSTSSVLAVFFSGEQRDVLPLPTEVEDKLAERLPSYMIPSVCFVLPSLPVTATDKIDRRQLRATGALYSVQQLADIRSQSKGDKRKPFTDVQVTLQKLWATVLNIDPDSIGLDDSFFRLGGDSITAMKLVAKALKENLQLFVADVFRQPRLITLAEIAQEQPIVINHKVLPFSLLGTTSDVLTELIQASSSYGINTELIEDIYPCTPLQEGLLALTAKAKQPGVYVRKSILHLASEIDLDRLCAAWERAVGVHPILRTRIIYHEKHGLFQVVMKDKPCWIQAESLDGCVAEHTATSIGFGQPLSRYSAVIDSHTSQRSFVWTIHHALYDGTSVPFILETMARVYHGLQLEGLPEYRLFIRYLIEGPVGAHGHKNALSNGDMNVHMNEHADWHTNGQENGYARAEGRKDDEYKTAEEFWRLYFKDFQGSPFPPLPLSVQEPAADSRLEQSCAIGRVKTPDITIATVIQAAWALVTQSRSGTSDVSFGVTLSGRNAPVPGIEGMVGPTIATIPLRIQFKPRAGQTIRRCLEGIQSHMSRMILYQQTGLQRIAKASLEAKQACGFQTLLIVQPPDGDLHHETEFGVWEDLMDTHSFGSYGLTLNCLLTSEGVRVVADYDSRVVDRSDMMATLDQFMLIIQQLAEGSPDQDIDKIDTLTEVEQQRLWSWNETVPPVIDRCLHRLVEEQAQKRPDAVAIQAWDGTLSYGELDRLANRLADILIQPTLGISPGLIVPLCFEKSMWTIVALLAVLKAGGVFCMLDPAHPENRLQSIVQQTGARIILSSPSLQGLCGRLGSRLGSQTVLVGPGVIEENHGGTHNTAIFPQPDPSSLMYIAFTSGSTGIPNGAAIPHAAFCSGVYYQSDQVKLTQQSRVLDFFAHAFDMFVYNVGMTLAAGACLCVPSDANRKNRLADSIVAMKPTHTLLTPSVLQLIQPDEVPKGQIIILLGEPLAIRDTEKWWGHVETIINAYGPCECTPISVINSSARDPSTATYIGKGAGVLTWVVDPTDHDKLVPAGVVGELLLEGPLVGAGYLNDPERTSQAFIQDPAWLVHGGRRGRVYKTGDLVRYHDDGSLSYIGRKDTQVKIYGQRIELGDVEHHVRECFPQAAAAEHLAAEVILPGGDSASSILAVFFSSGRSGEHEPNVTFVSAEVAEKLAARLPSYMIPSVCFLLPRLPVTTTYKIDRKKLRLMGASYSKQQLADLRSQSQSKHEKRMPSTEVEHTLQQLWATVLDLDPGSIGVDDSFFSLGGDSIAAMKFIAKARKANLQLSVADVFTALSITKLASMPTLKQDWQISPTQNQPFTLISSGTYDRIVSYLHKNMVSIDTQNVENILPTTAYQQRYLRLCLDRPTVSLNYFSLHFGTSIDIHHLMNACTLLVQCFPILRTVFVPSLSLGEQIVLRKLEPPCQVVQADGHLDVVASQVINMDKHQKRLPGSPFIAFFLICHKSLGHRLIVRISHAQYDAICFPLIVQALLDLYHKKDNVVHHPPFSDYLAHTQQRIAESATHWRKALQGSHVVPLKQVLYASRPVIGTMPLLVHAECSLPTPELPRNATMATLVSSAWALVLSSMTGERDVVYGQVVAGRNASMAGVSEVVGLCANIVPVRVEIQPQHRVFDLLNRVQDDFVSIEQSDSMGLHDIIDKSTNWPAHTDFNSVIQHVGSDRIPTFLVDGEHTPVCWFQHEYVDFSYIKVHSTTEDNRLGLYISGDGTRLTSEMVDAFLSSLCAAVDFLSSGRKKQLKEWLYEPNLPAF